jgi:xanthosine utilization system XapX-like protein
MAVHDGLHFGTQVVFTYGPLGFLSVHTVWFEDLAVIAFLYSAAVYVALCWALIWALRGELGTPLAALGVFLVFALLNVEPSPALAVVVCLGVLAGERSTRTIDALWIGGALFAAVEAQAKLSTGPVIVALFLITLIGVRARWWQISGFVALFGTAFLLLWLAAHQSLANLPDFAANGAQVVAGYSGAMVVASAAAWQAPVAALILVGLVVCAASNGYRDNLARWCAAAVVAIAGFVAFKEGVVRYDPGHIAGFFSMACVLWLAIPWSKARRVALVAGAVVLGGLGAVVAHHAGRGFGDLNVVSNVRLAGHELRVVLSPSMRSDISTAGREGMRASYRLDRRTLAEVRGRPVAIDPWEIGVAWAYDLDWSPLPVFQDYSAYTEHLDELNAAAIEDANGPQRILRENTTVVPPVVRGRSLDGRYPGWDPPAQQREMLCHFQALSTTPRWQVLGRTANRCGAARLIRSTEGSYGTPVDVPAPTRDQVVFARVHGAGFHGVDRLVAAIYRPGIQHAVVNGAATYRLVPATVADGLLLSAGHGLRPGGPFSQIPQARTIELTGGSGQLDFDFYAMSLTCRARPCV